MHDRHLKAARRSGAGAEHVRLIKLGAVPLGYGEGHLGYDTPTQCPNQVGKQGKAAVTEDVKYMSSCKGLLQVSPDARLVGCLASYGSGMHCWLWPVDILA